MEEFPHPPRWGRVVPPLIWHNVGTWVAVSRRSSRRVGAAFAVLFGVCVGETLSPREFQGNYADPLHFIDSWGDRATDGIVYGDGTPKDGYWLVRTMYGANKPIENVKCGCANCKIL